MRLVSYLERASAEGQPSYGMLVGERIVDLATPTSKTLRDALAIEGVEGIARRAQSAGVTSTVPVGEVVLLPPITDPHKILCVGLNYFLHAQEANMSVPSSPSVFVRFSSSFVGHREFVVRPPESEQFDYEAELAVVIGRVARRVGEAEAMDYVAGYSCIAENSVRDWQRHSAQATPGKNFVNSGAFGPWLVTKDEAPDYRQMSIEGRLNGEIVQQDTGANMIFPVPSLVAYLSTFTELLPGDVIATGTPAGVGMSRKPPRYLREGDVFEVVIGGVGELRNPVKNEF